MDRIFPGGPDLIELRLRLRLRVEVELRTLKFVELAIISPL